MQEISKVNNRAVSATGLLKSSTKALQAAIESQTTWRSGDHGAEFVEVAWKPPAFVSDELATEARQLAAAMQTAIDRPAEQAKLAEWLASLGALVVSGAGADEARTKVAAMASMLADRVPATLLTRATLERAARRWKWFPAYAEVAEFFDGEQRALETAISRMRRLVEAAHQPTQAELDASLAERQRVGDLLADLAAKMRAGFGTQKKNQDDGE